MEGFGPSGEHQTSAEGSATLSNTVRQHSKLPFHPAGSGLYPACREPWHSCLRPSQVNRRVCEMDVLGPDCDERRKACLEIRSSLRRGLRLQT